MSAHTCREFNPGCYRCGLGRDEEVAGLAEAYHEENIEPGLRESGVPDDALNAMRRRYISDVLRSPEAMRQLYEWAEGT